MFYMIENFCELIEFIKQMCSLVCIINKISNEILIVQDAVGFKPEQRLSYVEGLRDIAVIEAMLESNTNNGAQTFVKKFEF